MKKQITTFPLLYFILIGKILQGQDLAKIPDSDPLNTSGGINLTTSLYDVKGMERRRDPYSYVLNGNVNFTLFDIIDVPFSMHISKNNKTYTQPSYNRFGASPRYKFITLHAGYRNMHLSDYSMSGATFLGAGVELNPSGSWVKGKLFYGRFKKAVPYYDSTAAIPVEPSYKRKGYGAKVKLGSEKNYVGLLFFKAKDIKSSVQIINHLEELKPKENIVFGIETFNELWERLIFSFEVTQSAFSSDIRMPEKKTETYTYANNLGGLFTPRYSSSYNKAINTSLKYNAEKYSMGVSYKHIDPGYRSLGTTYLMNDVEDYTFNVSASFLKNKINISGNAGFQKNNLDNELITTNKRFIGSINAQYSVTPSLGLNVVYSNFNTNTSPSVINVRDTFRYVQVTQNRTAMINYQLGKQSFKHSFLANISYQTINTLNETAVKMVEEGTNMLNISPGYQLMIVSIKLNTNLTYHYNEFKQGERGSQVTKGPSLAVTKGLFKDKVKINFMYAATDSYTGGNIRSSMDILRMGITYRYKKNHNIRLRNSLMIKEQKNDEIAADGNIREYRGSLVYGYTF